MRQLPNFTIQNIIQYFIYQKEIDGLERQDWKSLNNHGYKLFKEGHIQQVYVSSSSKVAVKAICLPEMKKDRTYSLQLSIDSFNANTTTNDVLDTFACAVVKQWYDDSITGLIWLRRLMHKGHSPNFSLPKTLEPLIHQNFPTYGILRRFVQLIMQ